MRVWKTAVAGSLAAAVMAGQIGQVAAAPIQTNVATMKAAAPEAIHAGLLARPRLWLGHWRPCCRRNYRRRDRRRGALRLLPRQSATTVAMDIPGPGYGYAPAYFFWLFSGYGPTQSYESTRPYLTRPRVLITAFYGYYRPHAYYRPLLPPHYW